MLTFTAPAEIIGDLTPDAGAQAVLTAFCELSAANGEPARFPQWDAADEDDREACRLIARRVRQAL